MLRERASLSIVAAALILGCATSGAGGGPNVDLSVDALVDVNSTSATLDQDVHPNDYAGMVSAWYFGHAT